MKYRCPHCKSSFYSKQGHFFRKDDSKFIQRLKCKDCLSNYSYASFSSCYQQKKRRINSYLAKFLCSGMSQRRAALVLNINLKTVARKLIFLAREARRNHADFLKNLKVGEIQFDDLITSHHTKLKPLTLSLAVETSSRQILGLELGEIPAFGHLAKISRKKYGKRKSEHKKCLNDLFQKLSPIIQKKSLIESDEHKFYEEFVNKYAPDSNYYQYKSERASVVGQGELKRVKRDPLFQINHTLAMLRANVNRLFRRTWNTTKDPKRLLDHLWLYVEFHNKVLVG